MSDWQAEHGICGWLDEARCRYAFSKMGWTLPAYDELVSPDTPLTSQNIISVRAEHGAWFAVEFIEETSEGKTSICEAGVVINWESDGHPVRGFNPCYAAKLVLGFPAAEGARWALDTTEEAAYVYAPQLDPDTGEQRDDDEVAREVYLELVEAVERHFGS